MAAPRSAVGANRNEGRSGGTLTVGRVAVGPLIFHPLYLSLAVEREIADLVYGGGLLRRGSTGRLSAGLASPPVRLSGGLDWVFRLNGGIRFHDGKPLSADDVVFTYTLYKSSRIYDPIFYRYFNNILEVRRVDPLTVRFTMKEPVSEFPPDLATIPILPRHQLGSPTFADAHYAAAISRPVGLGPFKVETWPLRDNTVVLSANLDCYQGRPFLDRLVFKFYPTPEELQAAFITHEVDVVEVERAGSFAELRSARPDAVIRTFRPQRKAVETIYYNTLRPPFTDRLVRRALVYATDRTRIVDQAAALGRGHLAHGPVDQDFWAYGGATRYRYDPVQALALLRQGGWRDEDRDGVLDRGGRRLQFELLFPRGSVAAEKIIRIVKLNLNAIGVDVIPVPVEMKELVQRLRIGEYDAALSTQAFDPTPDDFYGLFHSEGIDLGFNVLGYRNRQVDRNISFLYGIKDRSRLFSIFQSLQWLISEDQPCMFLFFIDRQYVAFDPRCGNLGTPGEFLNPSSAWYIITGLR